MSEWDEWMNDIRVNEYRFVNECVSGIMILFVRT